MPPRSLTIFLSAYIASTDTKSPAIAAIFLPSNALLIVEKASSQVAGFNFPPLRTYG